jgi:hypothetical protein
LKGIDGGIAPIAFLIAMLVATSAATGWALLQWSGGAEEFRYSVEGVCDGGFGCSGEGCCRDTGESSDEKVYLCTFEVSYTDGSGALIFMGAGTSLVMLGNVPEPSLYRYLGESSEGMGMWTNSDGTEGCYIFHVDLRGVPVRIDIEDGGLSATAVLIE